MSSRYQIPLIKSRDQGDASEINREAALPTAHLDLDTAKIHKKQGPGDMKRRDETTFEILSAISAAVLQDHYTKQASSSSIVDKLRSSLAIMLKALLVGSLRISPVQFVT